MRQAKWMSERLIAFLIAVCALALYLSALSGQYDGDGVVFALWLKQALAGGGAGELWHPRHLIYLPMAFLIAKPLSMAGLDISSILFLQIMDAALAAGALYLFYGLCLDITRDRPVSLVASGLLAFSFGFWYYAIEPEVEATYIFLTLLAFRAALYFAEDRDSGRWAFRAAALGVAGGMVLVSQVSGGLLLLSLGWVSLWWLKQSDGRIAERFLAGLSPALVFSVTAVAIAGAAYAHGYVANPVSRGQGFLDWVLGRRNPVSGMGYEVSYWSFSVGSLAAWAGGFRDALLAAKRYRLDSFEWMPAAGMVALAGSVAGAGTYVLMLPRLLKNRPRAHLLLLMAAVPLVGLTVAWDPTYFEMKGVTLPFLWLASASAVSALRARTESGWLKRLTLAVTAVVALCYFAHNFCGFVRPGSDHGRNEDLTRALFVRDHVEPGAVVYISGMPDGFWMGKFYLVYFAGVQTRVMDWILADSRRPFPEPLLAWFMNDRQRPVYVLSELVEDGPALRSLAAKYGLDPKKIEETFRMRGLQKSAEMDGGFALYRIKLE